MGWTILTDVEEVVGDAGWDLAGDYIEGMIEVYMKAVSRLPTEHECIESVRHSYLATIDTVVERGRPDNSIPWVEVQNNLARAKTISGVVSLYSKRKKRHVSYDYEWNKKKSSFDFTLKEKP